MNLPFTPAQFFQVFQDYNEAVWPAQVLFYALAALVFYHVLRPKNNSDKTLSLILAFFWLWMGTVYHWYFFSPINPAARLFALLFVAQGLLLLYVGYLKGKLSFSFDKKDLWKVAGLFLMLFGPVIYPLLGMALGHTYPSSPTFGLPCPTTIFTIGTLLLAEQAPKAVFLVPILWSVIGFMAALSLGVEEDTFLLLSGVLGAVFVLRKK